jgi:hypothetical protein
MRNAAKASGYVGIPMLAVVVLFLSSSRRNVAGRVLAATFLLAAVASFGPWLWFAGRRTSVPNPLGAYAFLPVVGHALPARFVLYAFLAAGVAAALWLASASVPVAVRAAVAVAVVVSLLPNPAFPRIEQRVPDPPFFREGRWRTAIDAGDTVVTLPYGYRGYSMLWQARAELGFAMTGGYLGGRVPREFRRFAAVRALLAADPAAASERQLRAFLARRASPRSWSVLRRARLGGGSSRASIRRRAASTVSGSTTFARRPRAAAAGHNRTSCATIPHSRSGRRRVPVPGRDVPVTHA